MNNDNNIRRYSAEPQTIDVLRPLVPDDFNPVVTSSPLERKIKPAASKKGKL